MTKDPFNDPAMRALQDALNRVDPLSRLANDPTQKALRDLYESPAQRAYRGIEDSPALKAARALQEPYDELRRLTDDPAQRALRDLQDSPAQRALRDADSLSASIRSLLERDGELRRLTDDPTQRALRDLQDSPAQRALRDADSLSASIRSLLEPNDSILRPLTSATPPDILSKAASGTSNGWQPPMVNIPPIEGLGLPGSSWSQPRKSDELQRLAEAAGREKIDVARRLEQIGPDDGDETRTKLETVRNALSEQERQGRRAARLERRRERKAEADYWFRQWMNSLAIGNGAGFLAVTAGLLQASRLERALVMVAAPLTCFAVGLLSAGALRLLVWTSHASPSGSRREKISQWSAILATALSAMLFVAGVLSAVNEVKQSRQVALRLAGRTAKVEEQELKIRELEAAVKLKALTAQPPTQSEYPAPKAMPKPEA